jgi:Fe-S-cluster containining protein
VNRRLTVLAAHREHDAVSAGVVLDAPACAEGCSYCCHVHVDATRAEVEVIAEYLRARRAPIELAALTAHVSTIAPMDHEQRWAARIPCALLDERGRCSIHEVRPLRCRSFHSRSVEPCREAFAGPNEPEPMTNATLEQAYDEVEERFDRALESLGLSTTPVLLEEALLEALQRP